MKYYPIIISKKIKEFEGVYSFFFSIPDEFKHLFYYQPAQFLTFKISTEGKEIVRSYSLSSCPLLEEPMQTSIKIIEGGIFSNYIASHLKEGDEILSQAPLGTFFSPAKDLKLKNYVLFGAGIGVTPLFSILKTVLSSSEEDTVDLIYSNRDEENIIYKDELKKWKQKYPDRLKIKYIFSKKEGRLDAKKVENIFDKISDLNNLFYLCGPKDYMKTIKKTLISKGLSEFKIFLEDFNVVPSLYPKPDEDSIIFNVGKCEEEEPKELKATFFDEKIQIPLNTKTSILEQLLEEGYNVPFSCASGSCMSCLAKLKKGKVFQISQGVLNDRNIEDNELLTCQTYPLSKEIEIDYDAI